MSRFLIIFLSSVLTIYSQTNHSLSFDGVDDYVALTGKPITGVQNEFSILTQFKTNSLDVGQGIYFHGGGYKDIGLRIDDHDGLKKLHFFILTGTGSQGHAYAPFETLEIGKWHSAAGTYDGQKIKLYVDGILVTETDISLYVNWDEGTQYGPSIGGGNDQCPPFFGNIDEMSFWSKALTQEEILYNLNNGMAENLTHLDCYYNMNEGEGDILYDYSGNQNHGTINGAAWVYQPGIISVPTDFSTIQSALSAANENDTILVLSGTYNENILWPNTPNLHLISESGPEQTIIDGNLSGSVIDFGDGQNWGSILIEGFTIKNGAANSGAGLRISFPNSSENNLTMNKLIIENNYGSSGGGMWVSPSYGSIKLLSSIVRNNTGTAIWGNGLNSASFEIVNTLIYDNDGGAYGYGNFNAGNGLKVINCTVFNNTGSGPNGGAFALNNGNLDIVNSIIYNNEPTDITTVGSFGNINVNNSLITDDENSVTVFYPSEAIQLNWSENLYGDNPNFIDEANGDFHLSYYSVAIGAGTTEGAPDVDIEDNLRPNPAGSNPDLGAYENPLAVSSSPGPTEVSGIISSNTTWTEFGSPYIVTDNISLSEGVKLIIDPGVEVRFDSEKVFQVRGELIAKGTEDSKVLFTSNQPNPTPGDWGPFQFFDEATDASFNEDIYTGGSILEYCIVEYSNELEIDNSAPFIHFSEIRYNSENGISVRYPENYFLVKNCDIHHNSQGLDVYGSRETTVFNYNTIRENSPKGGGFAGFSTFSHNTIKNNSALNYDCSGCAGGIMIDGTDFHHNIISGNRNELDRNDPGSPDVSGLIIYDGANIHNNIITNNIGQRWSVYFWSNNNVNNFNHNIITDSLTYFKNASLIGSCVNNVFAGGVIGELSFDNNNADFSKNTILGSSGRGYNEYLRIYGDDYLNQPVYFTNNLFSGNNSGYKLEHYNSGSGQDYLSTSQNNIIHNDDFFMKASNVNSSVENNYWGTTIESEIQEIIYDWYDDSELGFLDYDPWLNTPNTSAPISPPFNVEKQLIQESGDIILTWQSNPESDLAGYKVHFGEFNGYVYETNIDIGNVNTYIVSGVSFDSNISVTAYDNDADLVDDQVEGHQSWFADATSSNVAPIAYESSFELDEDTILSSTLTAADEENDPLLYTLLQVPVNGDLELNNQTGEFIYMPNLNYFGTDNFVFSANDGAYNSDPATVYIQINPVNDAPVIVNIEDLTLDEDFQGDTNIRLEASDVDGDEISFSSSSTDFVFTSLENQNIYLSLLPNWYGVEEISVYATDTEGLVGTETFILTVLPVNDAPQGVATNVVTEEDNILVSVLEAIDAEDDPVTFNLIDIKNGTVDLNSNNGAYIYTPNLDFNGLDTLTFTATDGQDTGGEAHIIIEVTPINDAPVFSTMRDTTMDEDSELSLALSATDVDGDFLYYEVDEIEHISAYIYGDGDSILFIPEPNWNGVSTVTLHVMDSEGLSEMVSFNLTVNSIDDEPTLDGYIENIFVYEDFQDTTLMYSLDSFFSDIDGELTYSIELMDPTVIYAEIENSFLSLSSLPNAFGETIMTVTASNPMRASISDTVTVVVFAENDAPVFTEMEPIILNEDETIFLSSITELQEAGIFEDVDTELTNLMFDLFSNDDHIDINWDGSISSNPELIPAPNYFGESTLSLCVTDGEFDICSETMVTVTSVNDAPYFASEMLPAVGVGIEFMLPLFAEDIDSDQLSISLTPDEMNPPWVSLEDTQLIGVANNLGVYSIYLTLSDGEAFVLDTFNLYVEDFAAQITYIADVPNDQGGRVYVGFSPSYFDNGQNTGQSYSIFRRDLFSAPFDWIALSSVDAIGEDSYVFEALTAVDSSVNGDGMTVFKIVSSMSGGIFHSEFIMGYSVDNIHPGVPEGVMAMVSGNTVDLSWNESIDDDFQYYIIEKSVYDAIETIETADAYYIDENYIPSEVHFYRVAAVDYAGNQSEFSELVEVAVLSVDVQITPVDFVLHQNYPNPFNPTTQIKYDLPSDSYVNISIYDVMGRKIKSLFNNNQTSGYHSLRWDATNDIGEGVSAGMYIYTIQAGEYRATKKMVLLK